MQAGDRFVPQRESVPEQAGSSAAFLSAAIGGLPGPPMDASALRLGVAPQPPVAWPQLSARGVRVGIRFVGPAWRRGDRTIVLEVGNRGAPVTLDWREPGRNGAGSRKLSTVVPDGHGRWILPSRRTGKARAHGPTRARWA
ncbi:MAG TPA: hypothetical protein VFR91_05240 [Dyella sp.]|nr:hypothetical protein [Dyella sp.]